MPNQDLYLSTTRYDRISGARRRGSSRRFVVRLYELPWYPGRNLKLDAQFALRDYHTRSTQPVDPTSMYPSLDRNQSVTANEIRGEDAKKFVSDFSMYPEINLDAGPNDPKYPIRD